MKGFARWMLTGGAVFFLMMLFRGGFEAETQLAFYHVLCDALFVTGALLTGLGLLSICSAGGTFDMLRFGLMKLFSLLRREEKRKAMPKDYYEYVQGKNRESKPLALLAAGLCYLLLAGGALVLYARSGGL